MNTVTSLLAAMALAVGTLASAPPVSAVGACIGPILKSATFTYTDDSDAIQGGGPVKYAKIKVTVSLCRDTLGNEWAAALPTWSIPSGSLGLDAVTSRTNTAVTNGVRGKVHAVYFAAVSLGVRLHVQPYVQGVWSGGSWVWTKGDLGRYYLDGYGSLITLYDPTPFSSVWN